MSIPEPDLVELRHIIRKLHDAKNGDWEAQSIGEQLMCAIALNRPEWLTRTGFTVLEAIDRIGPQRMHLLPKALKVLDRAAMVSIDEVLAKLQSQ